MTLPIFYNEKQNCKEANSYSPSAGKPALAVQDWIKKFGDKIQLHSFEYAARPDFYLAHERDYVDRVLDCAECNGFGNKSKAVAESLPYTTGSMIAAAEWVLDPKSREEVPNIAISPTSGFHHAGYSYGGGYCTFNGLMVTAIKMHKTGKANKILILDFDQHFGDGTQNIIDHLGIDYIDHITAGKSYNTAEDALNVINELWRVKVREYDLVLFQAGADIHVNDPLGGRMTTEQMYARDANVIDVCMMRALPLVINLAGGYQRDSTGSIEPVLALHRQTIALALNRQRD